MLKLRLVGLALGAHSPASGNQFWLPAPALATNWKYYHHWSIPQLVPLVVATSFGCHWSITQLVVVATSFGCSGSIKMSLLLLLAWGLCSDKQSSQTFEASAPIDWVTETAKESRPLYPLCLSWDTQAKCLTYDAWFQSQGSVMKKCDKYFLDTISEA